MDRSQREGRRQVEEAGGELDEDGSLVLTRSVSTEGRSRASVGGTTANVSLLMSLADDLVAVHGQSDQQQLLKPGRQREALDKYAGGDLTAVLADYQRVFQRHKTVKASLAQITAATRERAAEAEVLRGGLAEIEKLARPMARTRRCGPRRSGWPTPTRCTPARRWRTRPCKGIRPRASKALTH